MGNGNDNLLLEGWRKGMENRMWGINVENFERNKKDKGIIKLT